jgi:hypothetical protein
MSTSSGSHPRAGLATVRETRDLQSEPAPRRAPERSDLARLTAAVSATATIGTLIVAGVVRVAMAGPVRERLAYAFRGVPARPDVAVGIFAHNARAVLGVLGLLLVTQITARTAGSPGRVQRLTVTVGELILAGVVITNVLIVGASLGAYGVRMARAALPQGPIELAAYSLTLALYLQGRRRALPAAHVAKVTAASAALLALAATLETFVSV